MREARGDLLGDIKITYKTCQSNKKQTGSSCGRFSLKQPGTLMGP
jgi:hypothetical protein